MFSTKLVLSTLLAFSAAMTSVNAYNNRIFLIRHGEKPADDNTVGLSSVGMQRAQCIKNLFTSAHGYNIGLILTQDYKSDGSRNRPYQTVKPLADALGLKIDHHCDRDDQDCARDTVKAFADKNPASKDVLICWEHDALSQISKDLGDEFDYPSSHFDLIYEIQAQHLTSNSPFSEHCSGLDS